VRDVPIRGVDDRSSDVLAALVDDSATSFSNALGPLAVSPFTKPGALGRLPLA